MDYLIGSLVTILTIAGVLFSLRYLSKKNHVVTMSYTQSYMHFLLSPIVDEFLLTINPPLSQSQKDNESKYIVFLTVKNKGYWIKNNALYVAPILESGDLDQESAEQVDTMSMNKVQLNEVMLIVEELTRGRGYDSRDPGK